MKALTSSLLKRFLQVAANELSGEWLLVGGTLLPAVGIDVRATVDIDLVGLGKNEAGQGLALIEIAERLNLPIDTINHAAPFFVRKAGYTKSDLILLLRKSKCTIYRPSVALYWRLKADRLSESDLLDCQHYLQYCRGQEDRIAFAKLLHWLEGLIGQTHEPSRRDRLRILAGLIEPLT